MTYLLFTATFVILLIWVMYLTKELDDFKQYVIDHEHRQIDINRAFDEILSAHIYNNDRHVVKTKE